MEEKDVPFSTNFYVFILLRSVIMDIFVTIPTFLRTYFRDMVFEWLYKFYIFQDIVRRWVTPLNTKWKLTSESRTECLNSRLLCFIRIAALFHFICTMQYAGDRKVIFFTLLHNMNNEIKQLYITVSMYKPDCYSEMKSLVCYSITAAFHWKTFFIYREQGTQWIRYVRTANA